METQGFKWGVGKTKLYFINILKTGGRTNMQNYNIDEQILSFDRVLPWDGQIEAVHWKSDGSCCLQIKAPKALNVSFRILEEEYTCERKEDGIWEMEYNFKRGIQLVQLIVDGLEVLTPMLPITYGYSRPYNYVALDMEDEDFYRIKNVPHGSVRKEYFFSKITGEWESCFVYTPYIYEKETTKEFPVLYLQHGHGENEVGWTASGKVNFILDNLIAEGKAVPFVVVMSNGMVQKVENGKRIVDFHMFEKQLLDDIIPFVEQKFRIGKSKNMRAMAGLSMGSLQTSMIGFLHPEYFSALGVFSGFVSDFITGNELDLAHTEPGDNKHLAILDNKEEFAKQFPIFFRAIGDSDHLLSYFESDDKLLQEKQITHIRKIYNGIHDWNVWRMCIRDFAQLLFKQL